MQTRSIRLLGVIALTTLYLSLTIPGVAIAAKPDSYVIPGDNVFPEGIAFEDQTGFFYVSSTTSGAIFRGDVSSPTTEVFLPGGEDGRTAAVGLDVDRDGRLFIAGGNTGQFFVYETASGELIASFDNDEDATFVNDVTVTRSGAAYFTDSLNPVLYRVAESENGELELTEWLDLTQTVIEYEEGFNLNGIVATPDGKYLIVVQSNTGELFRIDLETQEVIAIGLGEDVVTSGDGLVLQGHRLYVVRNVLYQIDEVHLSGQYESGEFVSTFSDPSFAFPTTAAIARGRLLVVNAQFDQQGDEPDLPFTVSSVKLP